MSYVFYDGNKIGNEFQALYLSNDFNGLYALNRAMIEIHYDIKSDCDSFDAIAIIQGGDEGVVKTSSIERTTESIRAAFAKQGLTVTIGSGHSVAEAFRNTLWRKLSAEPSELSASRQAHESEHASKLQSKPSERAGT